MDQTPPEDSLLASGVMVFETIVIEQALIDPLGSGSSLHEGFPFLGTPGNAAEKAQILIGRDIDGAAIGGFRMTDSLVVTVVKLAASQRAAKLSAIAILAETVVDHGRTSQTDRHAIGIDRIIAARTFFGLAA